MEKVRHRGQKRGHRALRVYGIWTLSVVLVNLAAALIPGLSDWYIRHIFPVWVNTYGRLMDIFPFSVGEWMLAAGVGLVCIALVLGLVSGLALAVRWRRGLVWIRRYYVFFAWTLLAVCTVMTLNCSLLYHASTFSEQYFSHARESYTLEELIELRNMVVERCNALALEMERDEEGNI
ncbi:MAG: DUF3810 family protein, partial [Acetatifactor sp.]|nr:DUF3810 family protein [Acetatifactor sp.]